MCVIVFARSLAVTFCTKGVVVLLPRVFIGFGIYVNVNDCRVIYAFKFWIGALTEIGKGEDKLVWICNDLNISVYPRAKNNKPGGYIRVSPPSSPPAPNG